jgi:hypothetical protein
VARLQRRWPHFSLSCTGPWAPYSFADGPSLATRETRHAARRAAMSTPVARPAHESVATTRETVETTREVVAR